MDVKRTREAELAQMSPAGRFASESRVPLGRILLVVPLVVACAGIPLAFHLLTKKKVEEQGFAKKDGLTTSASLLVGAPVLSAPAPRPPEIEAREERQEEKKEESAPADEREAPQEPEPVNWEWVRARAGGGRPDFPVKAMVDDHGPDGPRTFNVPRGTVFSALLEGKVVSDNLDSRVRAVMLEDFELFDEVLLPAGGWFAGEPIAIGSTHQDRIMVLVDRYVYPDNSNEVLFDGLLMNMDGSAHLLADDKNHHVGKVLAAMGIQEGFRILESLAGAAGSGSGDDVVVNLAQGGLGTASGVVDPYVSPLLQVVPTLIVEPGKPVRVFVDQSFKVTAAADIDRVPVPDAPPEEPKPAAEDAAPGGDEQTKMLLAQLQLAEKMLRNQPAALAGGAPHAR